MQKPFNSEGLDLTFLFDSTYPNPSITEANNMAAASNAMPGFTPEQVSSLRQMLSTSIGEALEPLLSPLRNFLAAWERGPGSLPPNTSSTHSTIPDIDVGSQPSTSDIVEPLALEPWTSPNGRSTKSTYQPNCSLSSNEVNVNSKAIQPPKLDRVPAKRKANAIDEAVISAAKKHLPLGLARQETSPEVNRSRTKLQATEEQVTPETFVQDLQPSIAEDPASLFLSPAPSQRETQPSSSRSQVKEESPTENAEGKPYSVAASVVGLRSRDTNQPEAWLAFAKSSADLKSLFKDEPRIDHPCPIRDYSAEKPASVATPSGMYERIFPRLPFNAPLGCAHIINLMKIYQSKSTPIKMADVIVTLLFNYCPDLLYAFLNATRHPEFIFTRREGAGSGYRNFSIERCGLTVTVSNSSSL